jgi:hypothetical protein
VGIATAKTSEPKAAQGISALYVASLRNSDLSRYLPKTAIPAGSKKARHPVKQRKKTDRICTADF